MRTAGTINGILQTKLNVTHHLSLISLCSRYYLQTNAVSTRVPDPNEGSFGKEDADAADECPKDPSSLAPEENEAPSSSPPEESFSLSDRSFDIKKDGLVALSPAPSLDLPPLSPLSSDDEKTFSGWLKNDLHKLIDASDKLSEVHSIIDQGCLVDRVAEGSSLLRQYGS